MNRRNFLQMATLALAGEGLKRCWPFRVYSFPAEIVIPSRSWEAIDWGFAHPAALTYMRDMHPYLVSYLAPCIELPLAELKKLYPYYAEISDKSPQVREFVVRNSGDACLADAIIAAAHSPVTL